MAIKYPATSDELKAAGFEYVNDGVCRGCGAPIEWFITPGGKRIPMDVRKKEADLLMSSAKVREPHFISCPEADSFRRK